MIFRNMKMEFMKILSGYGFYLCVLFTGLLCFSAYIYEDVMNGNKYSVLRSFLSFDRKFMLEDTTFCSFEVIRNSAGNWLFLFIPIIAAFAFVPLVCDEHESGSVRFEVLRSNKFCYDTSRFFSGCLCGGLAVMTGFIIFVVIVHFLFPFIGSYSGELQKDYRAVLAAMDINISGKFYVAEIVKKIGEMFLYGAFWAAPAMLLTGVIHNKYLILCLPFFLKYTINQTEIRMTSQVLENPEKVRPLFQQINMIVYPDALAELSGDRKYMMQVLFYSFSVMFLSYIVYLFLQKRRVDRGE